MCIEHLIMLSICDWRSRKKQCFIKRLRAMRWRCKQKANSFRLYTCRAIVFLGIRDQFTGYWLSLHSR